MAHKKAGSSSKNGRDSAGQRLGVKRGDGQAINAGDTATFTIVVSNTGTGPALGATLNDPLPAGGGVNWQTSSAGCSISGAPGAQTLACSFGDLAPGASVTVVVHALTSLQACATMPNLATASATNAPNAQGLGSITCVPPPPPPPPPPTDIPTLSQWGMLLLASLVAGIGFLMLRRRRVM